MQSHFITHNVPVEIPVVRVMNAAHFLLAYVFATTCSGDQREYDALAYGSVGRDKRVMLVTLIVLAAMLKRTEGFRAGMCRNMLLENRSEDFYEGVSLYDRFLSNAEKHFAEEDFLIDTHAQIQRQQEEINRLTSENIQLKNTLTKMENQQNNQYNHCVIYNAPVYNTTNTTNNYYPQSVADPKPKTEDKVATIPPDFFCVSARFTEENIRERLNAELAQAVTKIDFCRALYRLQHIGCINLNQYASDAQRAIVFNRFQDKFNLSASDFCKARMMK